MVGMSIDDGYVRQLPDTDPVETKEWVDSLDAVAKIAGPNRARFLMLKLLEESEALDLGVPQPVQTASLNTIAPQAEAEEYWFPGDEYLERRIRAFIRWNAA